MRTQYRGAVGFASANGRVIVAERVAAFAQSRRAAVKHLC
jgi:hypothetical protein